jgi:hypothetical protein
VHACWAEQEQRGLVVLAPLLAYNFAAVADAFLAGAYLCVTTAPPVGTRGRGD